MATLKRHIILFAIPAKNTWWIMKLTGKKDSYTQPLNTGTTNTTNKETTLKIKS